MVKVFVSTGDLEQRRRSRVDDAVARSNATSSSMSAFWFFDGNEELKLQYQAFCQADCNVPALFAIVQINLAMVFIRSCWWKFGEMNAVFIVATAVGLVLGQMGLVNFNIRASLWPPVATYPLPPESLLHKMRTYFQKLNDSSALFVFLNDGLFIMFPLVLSLQMLGRAMMGPCAPDTSFWDTQYCNPDGPGRYPQLPAWTRSHPFRSKGTFILLVFNILCSIPMDHLLPSILMMFSNHAFVRGSSPTRYVGFLDTAFKYTIIVVIFLWFFNSRRSPALWWRG